MNKRLVVKLEIKNDHVIKGISFEGLRKIGNPNLLAKKYYQDGIDEIIFIDVVASLYGRNCLFNTIDKSTKDVFVPITVGGGIKNAEDISALLNFGADKVAINTSIVKKPNLIEKFAQQFGSQCIVASIHAKKIGTGWSVFIENGRDNTEIDVIDWVKFLQENGAGEILLTSVDNDGAERGPDFELIYTVSSICKLPLIVAGGITSIEDINKINKIDNVNAISISSAFHYDNLKISEIKKILNS